jgi:hypothetical protein
MLTLLKGRRAFVKPGEHNTVSSAANTLSSARAQDTRPLVRYCGAGGQAMRRRSLTDAVLLAALTFVPAIASAQAKASPTAPPAVAQLNAPRWEASALIGLSFLGNEEVVAGTWGVSGAVRVRDRFAIAVEVGRQGYGTVHCRGAECRVGVKSDLCPCDEFPSDDFGHTSPYRTFAGSRYLAGPQMQISKNVFAHVLVGAVSTGIMPAKLSIRGGIGRDFGDPTAAIRIQADFEIVKRRIPREAGMSGLRLLVGLVFGAPR